MFGLIRLIVLIAVGVMAFAAARDPLRNSAVVYGLVVLLCLRGLQRFVFQQEIETAVNIMASRNVANGVFFLLLGVALFVLLRLSSRRSDLIT